MTADPILAALTAASPTLAAGRGRQPASDAGAAFLAVLAGLLPGGTPPRSSAPPPQPDITPTRTPGVVDRTSAVAGPNATVPASPDRRSEDVAGTAPGPGLEGLAIVPPAAGDGHVETGAVEDSNAAPVNPTMRGAASAASRSSASAAGGGTGRSAAVRSHCAPLPVRDRCLRSLGNEGQLSARIAVERVETLEILQRDAHTLERSLQDAGLRADSGGLSFSLRREPGQGERDGSPVAQAPAEAQDRMTAEPEAGDAGVMPGLRLLDIRACGAGRDRAPRVGAGSADPLWPRCRCNEGDDPGARRDRQAGLPGRGRAGRRSAQHPVGRPRSVR